MISNDVRGGDDASCIADGRNNRPTVYFLTIIIII